MNIILYNISVIFLMIGIILMIIYLSKINCECNHIPIPTEDIYDDKVSNTYKKMFKEPSVWTGYNNIDVNEKTTKIYI